MSVQRALGAGIGADNAAVDDDIAGLGLAMTAVEIPVEEVHDHAWGHGNASAHHQLPRKIVGRSVRSMGRGA